MMLITYSTQLTVVNRRPFPVMLREISPNKWIERVYIPSYDKKPIYGFNAPAVPVICLPDY